jgi:RimJ/RimL family protein N-acetyltransferase
VPLRPSYPVRTDRLLLRPLTERDTGDLLDYRSRADVCRWVPFEPMDAAAIAARLRDAWARTTLEAQGDGIVLGAEVIATGRLIGDVMLHWSSEEHRCAEIGYVLHPDHGGQGYATEAVRAVMQLAFADLEMHRVIARIDARNTASARLAVRVGMRQEAHLVENEWFKGGWSDELDFAILETEWRSQLGR